MNLNENPTVEQLREMVQSCDDHAGDHIIWVDNVGEVTISCVPRKLPISEFEKAHPDLKIRVERCAIGKEYVGEQAANDADWISELYQSLLKAWTVGKGKVTLELEEIYEPIRQRLDAC